MSPRVRALALTLRVLAACAVATVAALPAAAQSIAAPGAVAADPDVLGQTRLFSAWIEGQIAYRELPGVVVGVVAGATADPQLRAAA